MFLDLYIKWGETHSYYLSALENRKDPSRNLVVAFSNKFTYFSKSKSLVVYLKLLINIQKHKGSIAKNVRFH